MNTIAFLVIIVILGLVACYMFVNVPEKATQETEVIEAANEEEAAVKYLEQELSNLNMTDEELEQLLLSEIS